MIDSELTVVLIAVVPLLISGLIVIGGLIYGFVTGRVEDEVGMDIRCLLGHAWRYTWAKDASKIHCYNSRFGCKKRDEYRQCHRCGQWEMATHGDDIPGISGWREIDPPPAEIVMLWDEAAADVAERRRRRRQPWLS